ncbi:MAG: 30S ribosomal protein S14 [Hyphomicrobiaceae bacterium hypho_1]
MAKRSAIEKNKRRQRLSAQHEEKRNSLKVIIMDSEKPMDVRFAAQLKLSKMPRNGAKSRVRNRCEITGRPRAYYRKLQVCRNQLRELASQGRIPGMVKSSW